MSAAGGETRGGLERRFRDAARRMCFSNETAEWFCSEATRGQLAAACGLVGHEMEVREANRKARYLRQARFPQMKSLDGYDFSQISFPDGYGREDMLSLGFLDRAEDFVFFGGCGLGKTHLAIALGILCTQADRQVRYFQTADLVMQLKAASAAGKLQGMLKDLGRAELLILDEFGYIPIDADGGRLLYQVVAATYEQKSLLVTTNIEFSKWGSVLADEKLARATVDRIVHHGRLVEFTGQSRRLDNALMMGNAQ